MATVFEPVPVQGRMLGEIEVVKSERTSKWTSARSPATVIGRALTRDVGGGGDVDYTPLEQGIPVFKVTERGAIRSRVVTVSQDRYAMFITHQALHRGEGVLSQIARKLPLPLITRKGVAGFTNTADLRESYVRYIDVADLDFIQTGVVATSKLENARDANRLRGNDSWVDQKRHSIVTIGHHGNLTLDILVSDDKQRNLLVECLKQMRATYQAAKQSVSNEALLLRYIWYDVDADQNGIISEKEFLKILSRINFNVKDPSKSFKEFLKKEGASKGLTYPQAMTLLQTLKDKNGKSTANEIWDQLFGPKVDSVSAQVFLEKFAHGAQGEGKATKEDVEKLFEFINSMEVNIHNELPNTNKEISRQRFDAYLHHSLNSAYDPFFVEKDDDLKLSYPLSKYWINTSHNTYLSGDQLQSNSSVEMYMNALRRGCKCLELDCWDGETTKNKKYLAVVFHGHTLTSRILFVDIIRGVKAYMEDNPNTYPIILSLENHCSLPYQKQMAEDMKEIFGNMLYIPKITSKDTELPSPESLRGKVVIKGKRPREPDNAPDDGSGDADDDPYLADSTSSKVDAGAKSRSASIKASKKLKKGVNEGAAAAPPPKVVKELAELTLFHGTKYKDFEKSILEPPSHMHSISEPKISKILSKKAVNAKLWRQYNVSHMTRTYPAGARVDSSNYNPVLAWAVGCQLVALNFQTSDTPLLLNDGLFRQNDWCGYVLKPKSVLLEVSAVDEELRKESAKKKQEAERSAAQAAKSPVNMSKEMDDDNDAFMVVMENLEESVCGSAASGPVDPVPKNNVKGGSGSGTGGGGGGGVKLTQRIRSFQVARKNQAVPLRVWIRLLSGICLPKPQGAKQGETIDPYVIISLHDVKPKEDGTLTYVTSTWTSPTVNDNGFCPQWDSKKEPNEFTIHSPTVALFHFCLYENDIGLDDKVAYATIPVSCLRKGYRSIQLYDPNATRTGAFGCATLLIHTKREELK